MDAFPVVITLPIAWGDMDAFAHVNNTVYLRWFESARIAYFERVGFVDAAGVGPILASTRCSFRKPLAYPDTVDVGARVSRVGEDEFLMEYRVESRKLGKIAAEGDGLVVSYDYASRRRAPLPDAVRAAIERLEATRRGP